LKDLTSTNETTLATASFKPKTHDIVSTLVEPTNGLIANLSSLLGVTLSVQSDEVLITGHDALIAADILSRLEPRLESGQEISAREVMDMMDRYKPATPEAEAPTEVKDICISSRKKTVYPKTANQSLYVENLLTKDMAFGLGPAGTGKTFLAIGAAVQMLQAGRVDKIILTRPAVEAGEKLGYLPGDMKDKVDPFMQPLYDALNEFMTGKEVGKLIEEKVVEISPLAYMRGRTLKNSFVILDEAQNTTTMQMKMFLTRMGEGSRMVITGDPRQVDLPKGVQSGLADAAQKLTGIDAIGISHLSGKDVVRHPLVAAIIEAYETE
jgi:phosphate starvation-inducible protein PhoH and related proteins